MSSTFHVSLYINIFASILITFPCGMFYSTMQSLDILHPSTSLEWEEWPSLPVGMSSTHSVYLNGTLYVGGGSTDEPGLRAEASLYSFKRGVDSTWTVTDTPTYWYTLVVHDSELLLVGGREYPTQKDNRQSLHDEG